MEIARADLKLAPAVSRKGTEASRKSATMFKNPLVFREVSVLTRPCQSTKWVVWGERLAGRRASSFIPRPWGKGRGIGHTRKAWTVQARDAG